MGFIRNWLKQLIAGDELAALERYREACQAVQNWESSNQRCLTTARWIERHGESMESELGRAMHLMIGQRTNAAIAINN